MHQDELGGIQTKACFWIGVCLTEGGRKSEIRRPKSERMSKSEIRIVEVRYWLFGFLSDFGLRISCRLFPNAKLAENHVQQILRGGFADDFTNGIDGDTQVQRR